MSTICSMMAWQLVDNGLLQALATRQANLWQRETH